MKNWLFLILLPVAYFSNSQQSLYAEAAGHGGIASMNFEGPIKNFENLSFHYRMGMSYYPIDQNNGAALVFPLLIGGTYGKRNLKFEFGIGQIPTVTTRGSFYTRLPVLLGARFDDPDKKLYYKLAYTPVINYITDRQWLHWGGIGVGIKLDNL